jgi:hypothetical protein
VLRICNSGQNLTGDQGQHKADVIGGPTANSLMIILQNYLAGAELAFASLAAVTLGF